MCICTKNVQARYVEPIMCIPNDKVSKGRNKTTKFSFNKLQKKSGEIRNYEIKSQKMCTKNAITKLTQKKIVDF